MLPLRYKDSSEWVAFTRAFSSVMGTVRWNVPIPHRGFRWHQTCMYSQTGGLFSFRLTDGGELLTEDNLSLPQPESSMPKSVPDPLGKAHLDLVQ